MYLENVHMYIAMQMQFVLINRNSFNYILHDQLILMIGYQYD